MTGPASIATQTLVSQPGTKSLNVGRFGTASECVGRRQWPQIAVLMYSIDSAIKSNITCTCPPTKARREAENGIPLAVIHFFCWARACGFEVS